MLSGQVPRFYISVRDETSHVIDDQGVEFRDLSAATGLARKAMGEILAEELVAGRDMIHLTMMIDGEDRERLADLKVVAQVVLSARPFAG